MTEKYTYEELEKKIRELEKAESKRKWAEDELRVSEEKFRVLFEKNIHGMLIVDVETRRFPYANIAFCRMFGYSETEMLQIGVEDIHPKDSLDYILSEFTRQKQGEKEGATELPCIHKDGTVFNADIAATNIVINHRKCVVGVFIDITKRKLVEVELAKHREHLEELVKHRTEALQQKIVEQKQAEEKLRESESRFRDIAQSMADWIWEVDSNGRYTYCSEKVKSILGYTPKEMVGKTPFDFMAPNEAEKNGKIFEKIVAKKIPIKNLENWNISKDGRAVCFMTRGVPILNKNGELLGFRGVDSDITDFKKNEADQKRLESELQQAQKMESIGRLAGGVAHDYNNALTTIMGYTELAMTDADPNGHLHDNLNEILKASTNAKDITRQLLAFASKQTIDPQVIDLNTNIDVMLKMLRRLIGEDIDLAWFPGNKLWPVKMDPSQIDQILVNLCVNAKDAIAGVGKITIETDMVALDEAYCSYHTGFIPGGFVMMAISDNGCGMDKEILDNIFEPFFTTKDIEEGTGLGLATVYGIVKQNKGFINVYSEKDQGTTITIYLPRDDSKVIEIQKESIDEIPQGRGETILLVEDDIAILKLAYMILKGRGYKVLAANSPTGAIQMVKEYKNEIHLILTDVVMPEMYGNEMVIKLQALYPGLKHIFMSGYTAKAVAHHGVLDEGVDFIQKPFSKNDLATIVRKVLDRE